MLLSSITQSPEFDLAGWLYRRPHLGQTQQRIRFLIDHYVSLQILRDRLEDLPAQFQNPQPRPWQPIDWSSVTPDQVIGLDLSVFLAVVKGAMDTEAPIRGYTQTSRQYLAPLHLPMARFVGGVVDETGRLQELGLWEKEERQHSPVLAKLYNYLATEKVIATWRSPKVYQPSTDPHADLYRHGLHRIATEYSAVCLYLWLMAHTTGTVQRIFAELLQDEVNHMTKFWGFGVWAYPSGSGRRDRPGLGQTWAAGLDLIRTLRRMMGTLSWPMWSFSQKAELLLTFTAVLQRLWVWHQSLTPQYLQTLLGEPPLRSQ